MKKWIAILLAMSAVLALPACGNKEETAANGGGDSGSGGGSSNGGKKGPYTYVAQEVELFCNDGFTTVVVNGSALKTKIDGEARVSYASLDYSVLLIQVDYFDPYYILNGTDLVIIADSDEWSNAMLSSSGGGIAYTVEDSGETALYLYDVGSKKSTKVASSDGFIECTALAPDGGSLTYILRDENNDSVGCFFDGEKSVKLGHVTPLGLSDGGENIYAAVENDGGDTVLCLYNNKGEMKDNIGNYEGNSLSFNRDHTQLLYNYAEKTYISVNGAVGTKFFKDSSVYLVLPHDTHSYSGKYSDTCPVAGFYDHFYYSNNGIYRVKEDEEYIKLAFKVDYPFVLTTDASRIYYLNSNGDLKMVMTSWDEAEASEKTITIAEDVDDFVVTSDYSRVYYLDGRDLYSADGSNGESKKAISDDARGMKLGKGDILYFVMDGDLFACSDGEKATRVLSDLMSTKAGYLGYYYFKADDAIYCTTGEEKPVKILTLD